MKHKPQSSLYDITKSLSESCQVPVAAFNSIGDVEITIGKINEDMDWLRSHLVNPKIKLHHSFPNGYLLMSETRKLGFFFEGQRYVLPSHLRHILELNWKTLEHFIIQNESHEIEAPSLKELECSQKLKHWINWSHFFVYSQDSMRNTVFRNTRMHFLVPRFQKRTERWLKRLHGTEKAVSGKVPENLLDLKAPVFYLSLPGFNTATHRNMLFIKNKPFSAKEEKLAMDIRMALMQAHETQLSSSIHFCKILFNSFLCQNNPQQLFSIIFKRLKELLPFDFLALIWKEKREGRAFWKKAGVGNQSLLSNLVDTLNSKDSDTQHEISHFLSEAFSKPLEGSTFIPWQPILPPGSDLKHLFGIPMIDEGRHFGFLLLGRETVFDPEGEMFSNQSESWQTLTDCLMKILKSADYESQRENRFLEINEAYSTLLKNYTVLNQDSKILELEIEKYQLASGNIDQVFRFLDSASNLTPGPGFLNSIFRFLTSLTGFDLAGLAIPNDGKVILDFSRESGILDRLEFNELDGGIYHDLMFSREDHYWDGSGPRHFLLPSGHPSIENSFFIPFLDNQGNEGVVVLANHSTGILHKGAKTTAKKVIQFESRRLLHSVIPR